MPPEDRKKLEDANAQGFENGEPFSIEYRYFLGGLRDQIRWISVSCDFFKAENGEITEMVGIAQDITERKQFEQALRENEQRFMALFDNSDAAIFLKDRNGRYVMVNKHYESIYMNSNDVIGKTVFEFCSKEIAENYSSQDQMVLDKGVNLQVENEVIYKDGRLGTMLTTKFPIIGRDGLVEGVGGINVDITERKRLEEQLRQSNRLEAIGQLTGGVAHDFNNLMAIMMGNLEAAMTKAKSDIPLRNNIEEALKAVNRGAVLTRQLLSFSRQQTLSPEVTNIKALVERTLTFLERTLGENIQIITTHSGDALSVNVDTAIFGSALVNIALNARDAMPQGGTLTVGTSAAELAGELLGPDPEPAFGSYALITITDTGSGISQGDLKHIMEPFFTTKAVGRACSETLIH